MQGFLPKSSLLVFYHISNVYFYLWDKLSKGGLFESFLYWFISQMPIMARVVPSWSQEPKFHQSLHMGGRVQAFEKIICWCSDALTGSWIRNKVAGTRLNSTIWTAVIPSCYLSSCATMPAFISYNLKETFYVKTPFVDLSKFNDEYIMEYYLIWKCSGNPSVLSCSLMMVERGKEDLWKKNSMILSSTAFNRVNLKHLFFYYSFQI